MILAKEYKIDLYAWFVTIFPMILGVYFGFMSFTYAEVFVAAWYSFMVLFIRRLNVWYRRKYG